MQQQKEQLSTALQLPVAKFQVAEWGDAAVAYVQLSAGADATPLLEGLENDMCPCPHWGYVVEGAIHVRYTDGKQELTRAGKSSTGQRGIPSGWMRIRSS